MRLALAIATLWVASTSVTAQTIELSGVDGGKSTVSAADIAALPRRSLSLTAHGQTHLYQGPLLASVLERVAAPLGSDLRGPALLTHVVVRAADGYGVVLSLAEVDPAMRSTAVILADRVDGAPIDNTDGPFRLVVEGDARPARSVRQVTAISVQTID